MEFPKNTQEFSRYSEDLIDEKDLPSYLGSLENQALMHIQNNDFKNALGLLKRSEEVMESISTQGGALKNEFVIATLHNTAYCYHQLEDPTKELLYIDACYFNAKSLDFIKSHMSQTEDSIRKSKYIAKLALQYSHLLTSLNKSKQSLKFAKSAYKYSCKGLQSTLDSCRKQQSMLLNKSKRSKLSRSEQNRFILIERALPTLECFQEFLTKATVKKVEMRSALGIKGQPEWVSQFSMSELVTITPIKSSDFTSGMGLQAEFTKDYLFYKIALLAISLHFLGIRNKQLGNIDTGQNYCNIGLKFLTNFYNEECPIVAEIGEEANKMPEEYESPDRKHRKKFRRNKSLSYNISKFNIQSSSFTKIKSAYDRHILEVSVKNSAKQKAKRNMSQSPSFS